MPSTDRIVVAQPRECLPSAAALKVLGRVHHPARRTIAHAEALGDVQAAYELAKLLKRAADRFVTLDGRLDWLEVASEVAAALGRAPIVVTAAHTERARREDVGHAFAELLKGMVDKHISPKGLVDWVDVASDLVAWMKDNQR